MKPHSRSFITILLLPVGALAQPPVHAQKVQFVKGMRHLQ